jgi:hypothetical protein
MFPQLAFSCGWTDEAQTVSRYHPDQALAIARSERKGPSEHVVTTLYQTRDESREFFQTIEGGHSRRIELVTPDEAHQWMVAPDVKFLVLLYPELPGAETGVVGGDGASTQISDGSIVRPLIFRNPRRPPGG